MVISLMVVVFKPRFICNQISNWTIFTAQSCFLIIVYVMFII